MDELSGEQRSNARWATLAAGCLIAHQVAGKATRDALFLSYYDVSLLPVMMMAAAVLAAAAVVGLSRLLARRAPARVVPLVIGIATALLLAEWALSLTAPRLAALVVYLHLAVFGNTLVSGLWSIVNEAFDPWSARRVVGRIGTGAGIGGVVGGALAFGVTRAIPVSATLLVMAALGLGALVALSVMSGPRGATPGATDSATASGLRLVRETPYLSSLALIVGLGAATEALLDYALSAHAKGAFASDPEALMSFFALFHTVTGLLALGVQAALTRVALSSLGLAGTLALKPLAFTAGGVAGLFFPGIAMTTLVRGVPALLHNSLFRSAYELLYTPLPEQVKRPTKTILDVGVDKAGTLLGSGLVLALVTLAPTLTLRLVFVMAALFGLAVLGVCRGVHRGYVGALEQSLRSGAVRLDSAEVLDSTTRMTIAATNMSLERDTLMAQVRALRSGAAAGDDAAETQALATDDPVVRAVYALRQGRTDEVRRLLAEEVRPELTVHVIPLLDRSDVFVQALRWLRSAAPRATGAILDALLDPASPRAVRRRLPRALKSCSSPRVVAGLLRGLDDELLEVRYECGAALSRIVARDPGLRPDREAAWEAIGTELGRPASADPHERRRLEHVFNLLSTVLDREPLRIAYFAIQTRESIRGTALEYLENVLPERLREPLWALIGAGTRPPRPAAPRPRQDIARELLLSSDSIDGLKDALAKADDDEDDASPSDGSGSR